VQSERDVFSQQAKSAYQKALQFKSDWVAAKSNLAVLHQELLNDAAAARKLWQEVLDIRPDDEYAHYKLGLIELQAGNREEALEHLQKAPEIREAVKELKRLRGEPIVDK
jgi:tetratricopeptide (TPR) repeat protein